MLKLVCLRNSVLLIGHSALEIISSYTAVVGRLSPLPRWVGKGAILGLQGGTQAVNRTLFDTVAKKWGNLSDVAGVWLQDWTGQRNFSGANELPRVGLWWNWEVGGCGLTLVWVWLYSGETGKFVGVWLLWKLFHALL